MVDIYIEFYNTFYFISILYSQEFLCFLSIGVFTSLIVKKSLFWTGDIDQLYIVHSSHMRGSVGEKGPIFYCKLNKFKWIFYQM